MWFDKAITRGIQEHVDADLVPQIHPDPYFVDFLREAPEPTGEEAEDASLDAPKVYELVCSQLTTQNKPSIPPTGTIIFIAH